MPHRYIERWFDATAKEQITLTSAIEKWGRGSLAKNASGWSGKSQYTSPL
jgi:hypothetical protein